MRIRTIAAIVVFAAAGSAFAWGADGHRTVCQIAYLHLDTAHQKEVDRLAKTLKTPAPLPKYTSFAQGCTFPDDVKKKLKKPADTKRFSHFRPWHYLNVPRSTATITSDAGCNDNCVFHGIAFHSAAIKDAAKDQDRAEALLFLGHWVGDVHQPLHISYEDDTGGGDIKPINGTEYPNSDNLHSVWDTGIIANDMEGGWKAFANSLNDNITANDEQAWKGGGPVDWANESYQITIESNVQYCKETNGQCKALAQSGRTLTKDYQDQHQEEVETRLEQAGIRLADIIQKNLPVH